MGGQEFNENDNVSTPGLKTCKGVQKEVVKEENTELSLKNLGIDPKVGAKVNALKKPVKEVIEEVQEGDFEMY